MSPTNLSICKAASDLAFDTINDSAIAFDKTAADRAVELQLTDPQYQQLKRAAGQFRQLFSNAAAQDKAVADREARAAAAKPDASAPSASPASAPVAAPAPQTETIAPTPNS